MKLTLHTILTAGALLAAALLASAWLAARRDTRQLAATIVAQKSAIDAAGNREHQRDAQLAAALASIDAEKRRVRTPQQAEAKLPSVLPPLPLPITILGHSPAGAIHHGDPSARTIHPPGKLSPLQSSTFKSQISNLKSDVPPLPPPGAPNADHAPDTPAAFAPGKVPNFKFPFSNLKPPLPAAHALPGVYDLPDANGQAAASIYGEPLGQTISVPQADFKPLYDAFQDCRASAIEGATLKKDLADEKTRFAALAKERDAALVAARGGAFWQRLKRNAKWFAVGAAAGAAAAAVARH